MASKMIAAFGLMMMIISPAVSQSYRNQFNYGSMSSQEAFPVCNARVACNGEVRIIQ
jgi:hypothetical protein